MNFRSFKYFLTVCEMGTINAAARKLYISQQSLSQHIKKMETEVGAQLFHRDNPLVLTQAGKCVYRAAKSVMETMARMEQAGRAILAEVAKAPAKGKNIRKFTAYYLPTAVKVLTTYAKLDASGAQGQNAQALMAEVKKNANTIAAAFESQLDALFSGEVLDVSTDLKVLDGIARGDGLVDEGLKARLAGTAADLGAQNEDGPTLTL